MSWLYYGDIKIRDTFVYEYTSLGQSRETQRETQAELEAQTETRAQKKNLRKLRDKSR